ncbi:hypothetical protein [Microbispora sp. NPDC046933]|uniref:hypothetical protein n=1 Tax=Microbispora sp. NPDC046933 TaxID=3155618 RepID=UPI0033CF15BB
MRRADIQLELLTGPLQGVYDPSGHGAALFAFFAGMAESEREYIREKSLEGQVSARECGRHGGRPKVFDDDMAAYARGVSAPEIAAKLVIPTGKNKGPPPIAGQRLSGAGRGCRSQRQCLTAPTTGARSPHLLERRPRAASPVIVAAT